MKILYIVPYMPNLIRSRPYNLTRSLARRGHQVTVATLFTDEGERADQAQLEQDSLNVVAMPQPKWRSIWNCVLGIPTLTPMQAVYSWNTKLASQLEGLLECNGRLCYDVIHVEHLRGAKYGLFLKSHSPKVPVVWDSVDCISYLFEQAAGQSRSVLGKLITRIELFRTRGYEGWLTGKFDHVLITSPVDRGALLELAPRNSRPAPVTIIPSGVDLDYFGNEDSAPREPATVILSGKMSYHANVTMASYLMNDIMPHVWDKHPEVKVLIVGKDPPALIRLMAENPAVTVTGTVDDIRPYLQRATLAVVPLVYGAGSQLKTLEAMASRTPVVATSRAVLSLQTVPDRDLLVAEQPVDFAAQMIRLIEDRNLQQQVGKAGRQYVEANHQWARIAGRLEGVYDEVISTRV